MTEFFNYDNLTWPEVADLPRDVPLVLPLGPTPPAERVTAALGNPARLGILPAFPFGWRGSGLEVGDRKSTRLNSSHIQKSRMPSSA